MHPKIDTNTNMTHLISFLGLINFEVVKPKGL